MGALLVGMAASAVLLSMALPVWSQAARREREAELVFRGEQYARAIRLYQRVHAGALPPDIETLLEERFLRRRYRDPMVEDGAFRIVYESEAGELRGAPAAAERPGEAPELPAVRAAPDGSLGAASEGRGGVAGVVSRSTEPSLRIYNGGARYSEWLFLHTDASDAPGPAPAPAAGERGASGARLTPGQP